MRRGGLFFTLFFPFCTHLRNPPQFSIMDQILWKGGFAVKLKRMLLALLLCLALLLPCGATAFADPAPFNLRVMVGDRRASVQAFQNDYANNYYISLSDLSAALDGTRCKFRFYYENSPSDGEIFHVDTGYNALKVSAAGTPTASPWISSFYTFRNRLFLNGQEHRYYTYRVGKDLFMSLTDIQLLLDLPAELQEDGVRFYPDQHFYPDVPMLAEQGYFECFNAVLLADADTGEVLYASNAEDPVPIASISKLMTYLLLSEADKAGTIHFYDQVPISANAAALSQGADAMVTLKADTKVPAKELLQAMLLASSNESALAMAEYAAGSESAFVDLMNQRAEELGMDTARFYNPHGLPVYLPRAVSAKVQNRMSAMDLFVLCQAVLEECPEILEITKQLYAYLPTLTYNTANSNAVVFNLPGCNGLKTGSTNKAGSCLAATLPVTVDGQTHTAVAIVLGAESADSRNQAAEILLRYAQQTFRERGFALPEDGDSEG